MSIEQHAEAAADAIFELYVMAEPFTTGAIKSVAWNHMQFAIDEATAPMRARIEALEGLGPLIDDLEREVFDAAVSDRDLGTDPSIAVTKNYIRNILKGGAQ